METRAMNPDTDRISRLVESNLPLARYYANQFNGIDFQQAFSVAMEGLLRAAKTFDESKGRFSSYAGNQIKWGLMREHNKQAIRRKFFDGTQMDKEVDGVPISETIMDESAARPGDRLERCEFLKRVKRHLYKLPPKLVKVIQLRFRHDMDFSQIGRLLGMSKQAAHQNYHIAIRKMRRSLGALAMAVVFFCATSSEAHDVELTVTWQKHPKGNTTYPVNVITNAPNPFYFGSIPTTVTNKWVHVRYRHVSGETNRFTVLLSTNKVNWIDAGNVVTDPASTVNQGDYLADHPQKKIWLWVKRIQ